MGNVDEHIRELKRRKEDIENVLSNPALLPEEIKTYMEDLHDINRQLLWNKRIKNCY